MKLCLSSYEKITNIKEFFYDKNFSFFNRQNKRDPGSHSRFAFRPDPPTMGFHQVPGNGQTQPGATA
jgi:hypothetical protein